MTEENCASIKDAKLYILEIFVDHVQLSSEKAEKINPITLGIDFRFRDFPLFRIYHTSFEYIKQENEKQEEKEKPKETNKGKQKGKQKGNKGKEKEKEKEKERFPGGKIPFKSGKVYMFTKNPTALTETLRSYPLNVDLYRIKRILTCPVEDVDKEVLGEAEVTISGCLCDQSRMADNDVYHLGRPYFLKNTYNLIDRNTKALVGSIYFFIRLTCHNQYLSIGFAIVDHPNFDKSQNYDFGDIPRTIFFRNGNEGDEFCCTKIPFVDESERREIEDETRVCLEGVEEKCELDLPPQSTVIFGFSFLCEQLACTDGYPKQLYPPERTIESTK